MRKAKKKSFNWYGMKQHFSIRKYHFGAASVLLGMSLVMGAGAQTVKAEETAASSDATTATVASSTDSSASSETVVAEATVASTTETVASTERTATINYIVQYVLEDGTLVKADVKTTSVTTTEATATSTVEVATELPLGYELATGQAAKVSQEVTENGANIVTVKVVKKAEEKASTTSETTSSATTTATEEATTPAPATVAETVKTPATVEEAKVVLEQVTSEAEVLANEAERLVAASDSDNTALKAAAAATKLTATEATAVLNDSAATLEAVNAQIDAVRTNVEALALELRKFLGTDAIEIALNTSVSNLNVTEGEGILVGTTSTATPTMDDPHGASVGRHSLPTGVATTEDGWFTFAVYDLRSYNTNQAGKVIGGTAVPAYIRYSLDKDPTTATVLAELVSTTDGRVLEKVTIEPGAEVALSYPTTVDAKNEPVKLVYDTSEAVEGGVSGTIQFSAQDKNSGNFGSYSTTYVPPYVVNTTRYVTENGDLIATYNVQTISGQPVTSSGQREFTGVEYVSQSIEVADSIYPKGSKSVATTYDIGTAKVKVIREVVDHGKMTLTFYVTDPSYTKPYDLVTTDTTGFLPVFQTSELTHRVGDKYVYNHNQNFIGNYIIDPNDPTGSRKIYAVSSLNDQGSMYRIVANFSGDNTTDGTSGRLYLSTEVWTTKTNGVDDKDFAWHTGLGGDTFHNKGYAPGGRQNILRVGTLASANQITYVYRALEQEAIIRYQVEGATDYLEESAIQTGGSGSDINYSTEDTINKYKKLGYTLVSDDFTSDAGQDYDYDTAVRQEFLVVIKPRIEEVPNTAVPGQPVDPTDPNSPVWPDSINNLETTQEVTRTTEYKYEDGTPVRVDAAGNILPKGSEGTPLVKTETVTFTRPAQVNLVTGEVTYGEWAADSTDVLNGNLIPEISDYTATRTTLEGADAPMTESVTDKTVVATDADINEVVFYKPNPKYGDVVVNYVNTDGKVIATPVVDTNDALVGTDYSTADQVPAKIVEDATGDVYYYKEIKAEDAAKETGKVVEGTTEVTYVYEKAGNVVVNYIAEDGTVIKAPVNDETNAKPGTEYSTTDNKPTTITTEDGKTYELIPTATIGTEEGTVEAGKTTEVTYVYKEVKGSVVVNYVTTDGTVLQAPVTDTPETSTGTAYDTTDNKPTTITTADGKTYRLVPKLTVGNEDGTVVAGVTEITYVYEEVKGDVVVNYVNTDGKVIATPVVDTKATSTGTAYDTTDNKPEKIIEDATGDVYYYKEVQAGSNETGKVVEGTTEVTYVYEKAGNVVVNYITEDGTVIKTPVNDETNAKPGSPYDTTDNKPKTITTEDGTTYELVRTDGNENGSVEGGKTTEVTYVYRKVEAPVAKTGNVVVEYYNTAGEKIAADVEDTPEAAVGTVYETLDYKPTTITKDGVKYYYKEVKSTSATEKGTVTEGTTTVQYVYEPGGSVTVNYVTTDGTVIKSPVKDEENAEPGKSYTTEDNKPTTITTEDGKTYKLVPNATTGDENGTITSGEDKQVTYVYEEVKGNVVVNYIDTEGNVIKTPVEDTKSVSTGTAYDTTDNKPTTITTEDGTEYRLVPVLTKGEETGKVVEGTTQVTYVYQKVTTPAPKPNGSVVVNYVNTNGETIATSVNDTTDAKLDTPYDTTDYKPTVIKHDGVTYYYKEVKSGDSETGNVVEGTTEVTYIYEPGGSVTVNYVTTDGTVIKSPVKDEENAEPGKSYTTEDNKPTTITTEDGKTYKLVPNATTGDENGTITSGEDKQVTYVYEEVKGNVVVNYIDTEGNVIKTPVEDTKSASTGTAYDTTDNKPTTITTEDGTVYEIVPVLTIGSESGSVVEGTTQVTYVYRKVSTPTPAVKNGTVVVNYVTEDGTVIKSPVTDTPTSPEGTSYDTTDNKPTEITTEDGSRYVLIPSKTIGSENGTVVEGETVVTYVYKKVANWIPEIPSTPENPTPVNPVIPYPFDPTNPDKPVDPTTPGTNGEVPNIPYVPGYTPVDPKDNTPLKPVDPNDPGKGYVPPTPDETGKDTPIPYVQNGNVVVNYVTEDGKVIKAPVQDETNVPAGKSYDTTDNKPKTITTEDGTTYELVRVDGSENGKVEGGKTTEVTYVYRKVTPAKKVVTNHVDEEGNPIAPQEEGTTPDKSIPGYEFTGKTITDEDGNTTHIYKKTPTKTVITKHVDEEGNPVAPQEDGTTPNKSIPGYEYVRTVVDVEGNTTHIYRKVSNKPTPPATETPVKPQPATPTPTADKAKQLPNTGEASSSAGVLGAAMLVAAIALAGKRRRNED
ncbi:TPA: MucBP domain-containing protein [Streptococcus suis]|nr:MucBP domain-containing protein [Streptococcus suis]